jgi:hypothetical protein
MSDDSFRKFRCWRSAQVYETVVGDIGALRAQDDAVFLAAHAPVPIQQLWGPKAQGVGEAQILNALRDQIGIAGRNTLIAVTGDVGTGKSHAVRWVRAHLNDDPLRYRTIYVPRDLSTLRSLLGRILGGLPGEKARQAERQLNDAIAGKSDAQLRDELIDNLRQVLNHELPDQGPGDQDADDREERTFLLGKRQDRSARRRDGLGDILLNLRVIQHFTRDDGTVAAIIHSIQANRGGRDESYPHFTPDDIPKNATDIINRLDPVTRSVWESVRTEPKPAVALLNEALQRAVSMTLGFGTGGITLNEVFNETRKLLRQEGTELILLFEDLALFGLVDDDLYDQFSQPPLDDYCPLRVVFAITTAKYLEMRDTVRDRVTHRYDVQNIESGDGDGDPAMVTFVARYLNNARVGRDALIAARLAANERTREDGSWVPNACDIREQGQPCRHRDECFDAFGSVDTGPGGQVGLYPHNLFSLQRAFRRLRDENRLSPRSLVNEVVQSFLVTAEPEIGAGVFPTEEIRNWFYLGVNRAREAIVREDELPSPEARERLRRARIVWADGEPEPPGIHLAFDLPGKVTDAGAPSGPELTPTPPSSPSPAPERVTDRVQFLYDWESNVTRLPVHEMESFRKAFHDWTTARLDLGRHLVNVGSGMIQLILRRIFPETTFVIAFASGAEPAPGRLRFDVRQSSPGLRLLLAARWFGDHGHWDPAAPDRQWDFPASFQPAELQIELENFLSDCAASVEERFLQAITSAGGMRPAPAVVALRAAALRVLGQLRRDDPSQVITAVAQDRDEITHSWSPAWTELARSAREVVRALDAGLIADFAAARQGDTGEPIVVDAAALEPAGHEAIDDPATVAARLGEFSDIFSEIERSRVGLTVNWAEAVTSERQELLVCLQFLRAAVGSTDRDIVAWAEELGTRANDDRVFRPAGSFLRFRQEIEAMKSASRDVVDWWISCEAAIRDPDDSAAIFDAQSWAAQARSYAAALQFVLEAMNDTAQLLKERTARRAGGNPDELAERVAARLDDAASLLEHLGQRRST